MEPGGFPLWVADVEPGSMHDLIVARERVLGALYWTASHLNLPTLADPGGGTAWLDSRAAELAANPANRTASNPGGHRPQLSQRELSILKLLSQGLTNRQICTQLGISVSTVETHVSRIMTKLHVATRVEAVLYAIKHELVAGPV